MEMSEVIKKADLLGPFFLSALLIIWRLLTVLFGLHLGCVLLDVFSAKAIGQ